MRKETHFLLFDKIGSPNLGYISVAENHENIPFDVKRVYWTYYTPQDITRGGHAHLELEQVIVAVSGTIIFNVEDLEGNKKEFILDSPDKGLYLPNKIWRDIKFSHNAVLLCLASEIYKESDYIRDYSNFLCYVKSDNLTFIDYSSEVLEKSWDWLNDPEIKELTATPDFSKADQIKWFNNLKSNNEYFIRGISIDNKIIGAAGLKNINHHQKTAEYFGYIGDKSFWGKRLSAQILRKISTIAKLDLSLNQVYLNVRPNNQRAIKAYTSFGFTISESSTVNIRMSLDL